MKKVLACLMAGALFLVGCSSNSSSSNSNELVISTWGLNADIIREDVYAPFEEENDCTIVTDEGGTSDRYTKFSNNPDASIDIIELSQAEAQKGYAADLFEKLDYSKIENASDLIDAAMQLRDENGYGVPYTLNSIGIIYDPDQVGFEITEWNDLWDSRLQGKISIPEITTTFGPAMVHIASDYKGVDIKSDDGAAAFEALAELKPNIVKTYSKSSDLTNMFSAGEISVAVVADYGVSQIQNANENCVYVVPASGTYANFNTIEVNKNSENKELAYKYISWRLSADLQYKDAVSDLNEAPTNKNVVLTEEEAKNKTYGDIADRAKVIDFTFVNPLLESWVDQWTRILNS
ncbi:ABC transporter substrate-binding protein [uncultured Thomasclavelia sp.]|uniref:ABC transporter substrate-binding protein n=1 Tax=uncultured Thomasclavelia sp. TaxID=3025759 RepID=UPI0025DCA2A8|nr:ABC transporter substrate-binding protein [uncultured Thomasclavelia sp.]